MPIGERAAAWLRKYIAEARPQLAIEPDDFTAFLTADGEPFSRDHLTYVVKERIDAAKTGKGGACHLAAPLHGDAHARERGRHPFYPADPRTRGHQDHADLYPGGAPGLAAGLRGDPSGGVHRAGETRRPCPPRRASSSGNPAAEELAAALERDAAEDREETGD